MQYNALKQRGSLSEIAMYRFKQQLSDMLNLRCYSGRVGEIMAGVYALNKMSRLGMPARQLAGESVEALGLLRL